MFFVSFSLFWGAFILSRVLFAPSLIIAYKTGALDRPDNRKIHSGIIPRCGGIAFFGAFVSALLLLPIEFVSKVPIIIGGSIFFLVGFWDDTISLTPLQKLAGQFLGASAYILSKGSFGFLEGLIIVLWLMLLSNATNLSDGVDGLAGGASASQAVCISVLAIILNNTTVLFCSFLLIGAILGFLPKNFPNAKIFMGDCGSLFLGFVLAALSTELVINAASPVILLSIYLIFRVPIADTVYSFFRRILKKRNPFSADRGHFHHRLLGYGFSKECTTLALVCASLFFGLVGITIACV